MTESFFHVGLIVPELEPALEHLTATLGYSWRPTIESPVDVYEPARGERTLCIRFAYSQEAPHLEVIETLPDSPWALSDGSNLHHLGFSTESVPSASLRLTDAACPLEMCVRNERLEPDGFAYHHVLPGVRIEMLALAGRVRLVGQLAN
jgi:hypothetical protein